MTSSEIRSELEKQVAKAADAKARQSSAQGAINDSMIFFNGCANNKYGVKTGKALERARQECRDNWTQKITPFKNQLATATSDYDNAQALVTSLTAQLDASLASESASALKLAEKGLSAQALAIEAQGTAQARQIEAQGVSEAIQIQGAANASNSKKAKNVKLIIILSSAVILLAAASFIIYKRLKK